MEFERKSDKRKRKQTGMHSFFNAKKKREVIDTDKEQEKEPGLELASNIKNKKGNPA